MSFYDKRTVDFYFKKAVKLLVNDLELVEAWVLHFGKMDVFQICLQSKGKNYFTQEKKKKKKPRKYCLPSHRKSECCTNLKTRKKAFFM